MHEVNASIEYFKLRKPLKFYYRITVPKMEFWEE